MLTRGDGTLDITRLSSLVDQVSALRGKGHRVVMVSSGAMACGRSELRHGDTWHLDALAARQLFSAVGQAKLINHYYEFFREHGLHCAQVLATKENFARRGHYLNQRHCIETLLHQGVVPIVNENDTVSVTELMFTDNDELAGLIAAMVNADRLFILSNIDGLYTGNPHEPGSELIRRVCVGDDIASYVTAGRSSLGRGGMVSKSRIAMRVAAEGIEVRIANGTRPDILCRLCDGPDVPCTIFEAAPQTVAGVKKWIAHSDAFATGAVSVNAGAAEALCAGASLLPVGVTAIDSPFDADDIITIAGADGRIIAWGKAEYGSAEAESHLGVAGRPVLVHADYLYVERKNPPK